MTNPTKLCPACGCEKPLEEFREFWDCINQRYRRRGKRFEEMLGRVDQ